MSNPVLARRLAQIRPPATLALSTKAMALKAQGRDIANMGVGEPDFEMPDRVRLAAVDAMNSGQTRYTPMAGTRALRGAIAAKLLRENGMNHSPGEILVSNGAKQAIYNAVRALVDPGDEVIFLNSPNNPSGAMYSRLSAKCRATIRTSGSSAMTSTSICWWVTARWSTSPTHVPTWPIASS